MAESMTRRQTLKSAWADYWADDETRPPINHYFECGFDAAWDALMAEIRPLVADLRTLAEFDRGDLRPSMEDEIRAHFKAVNRLRALVREVEGQKLCR